MNSSSGRCSESRSDRRTAEVAATSGRNSSREASSSVRRRESFSTGGGIEEDEDGLDAPDLVPAAAAHDAHDGGELESTFASGSNSGSESADAIAQDAHIQVLFRDIVGLPGQGSPGGPREGDRNIVARNPDPALANDAPAAAAFATDGEFLAAIEQKVNETIAKLDAGSDYEQNELTEAIVRRRLQKSAGIGELLPSGTLRAAMDGRPPPLIVPLRQLYPEALEYDVDDDEEDDEEDVQNNDAQAARSSRAVRNPRRGTRTTSASPASRPFSPASASLGRPDSTNQDEGIRPFRPSPEALDSIRRTREAAAAAAVLEEDADMQGDAASAARGGVANREYLLHMCSRRSVIAAARRWSLSVVSPFVVAVLVAAVFHGLGGPVCGEACTCSTSHLVLHLFTYGLAIRILPRAVIFTYMLHALAYAEHEATLQGNMLMDGSVPAEGDRGGNTRRSARQRAGRRQPVPSKPGAAERDSSPASWDLPALQAVLRQRTAQVTILAQVILVGFAISTSTIGLPTIAQVPAEVGAFAIPLISCSFYLRTPQIIWPLALLLGFPYVGTFAEPRMQLPSSAFFSLWPFLVVLAEKTFFYLFRFLCLPSTPVGLKIVGATMFGCISHMFVLTAAATLDTTKTHSVSVALIVQVLLYELLLGTVLLDRLWMQAKAQWQYRVQGTKVTQEELVATDVRCIATQTRWTSQVLAVLAVSAQYMWRKWPSPVLGGIACDGVLIPTLYGSTFGGCVGAFCAAAVLTAFVRNRHNCLRPPLMVKGRVLPVVVGTYLCLLAPLGWAAGAHV